MNSTHKVEIVPVTLKPHPNADKLAIVEVFGYTVLVDKTQWVDGQLGAYIPPDSIVDSSREQFAWLKGHERIRVKKLRGIVSMGLLVPEPEGMAIGGYWVSSDGERRASLTSANLDRSCIGRVGCGGCKSAAYRSRLSRGRSGERFGVFHGGELR